MQLFEPGRNVWKIAPAQRAKVLIDGAAYFDALRSALKKARHSILIIGWDLNSHVPLVGPEGCADDGYPEPLCDLLNALTREHPQLRVNLLLWDFSVLYSGEREFLPSLSLGWPPPHGIQLCLDDALPLGSAHHQKIVVIDDCVAFSGGLDITDRRWDTCRHDLDNPARVDLSGKPYRPFHDVQIMLDGEAARQIGELARTRWLRATLERLSRTQPAHDCWPEDIVPDFENVNAGIALTQPCYDSVSEQREVEQLFLDSIDLAENHIYIENQFLTRLNIAEKIVARMRERPDLEVLIVAPHRLESWIEARTMRTGRINFRKTFEDAGMTARMRMLFPEISEGGQTTDTMVHSKVMIVDDVFLRIGSANLNNRSMGSDTECDIAILAENDEQRAVISRIRNTLLGEHCGVGAEVVEEVLARTGSLIGVADTLSERGHRLRPVEDGEPDPQEIAATIGAVADPERTVGIEEFTEQMLGRRVPYRQISRAAQIVLAAALVLVLTLMWRFTPLAEWADPEALRAGALSLSGSFWAPFAVVAIFVVAGFVLFPLTVLIIVTAGAFGPWPGLLYAGVGALASSLTTYGLGARLGKPALRKLIGPRLNRVARRVADKGVLTVAAIRLVPVAPFTVVNLVAGASGIRFFDFVLGTIIGLLPGLIILSSLGNQIVEMLSGPSLADILLFVALVAIWIGISFGLQLSVTKLRARRA